MLGDFTYSNPTKLYFGENALNNLSAELKKYGENVILIYGGGSIKKNGIYDEVMDILKKEGKNVAEIAGVMPNPTIEKLDNFSENDPMKSYYQGRLLQEQGKIKEAYEIQR